MLSTGVKPFTGGPMCQVARPISVPGATTLRGRGPSHCQALGAQHENHSVMERRDMLLGAASLMGGAGLLQLAQPVWAEEAAPAPAPSKSLSSNKYADDADKFELAVPTGWVQAEGTATGNRRTVAFFPADRPAKDINITVVVTNVSVEFTKLGSFGNVATFAGNLVNSLDRSFLLRQPSWARKNTDEPVQAQVRCYSPPVQAPISSLGAPDQIASAAVLIERCCSCSQIATLVDYKEARGQYFVEYTVEKLPEPKRHLLSTLALGNNGRYNRLYTVTAQCGEEELGQYRPILQAAVDSFVARVTPNIV